MLVFKLLEASFSSIISSIYYNLAGLHNSIHRGQVSIYCDDFTLISLLWPESIMKILGALWDLAAN